MKPIFLIPGIISCLALSVCLYPLDNDTAEPDNEPISGEFENDTRLKQALDYYLQEQNDNALALLDDIVKTNENDYRARILRGNIYSRTQQFDLAEKEYKRCISIDSSNTQAYVNLGMFYTETGKPYKALEYLREADTIRPHDAVILYLIGNVYFLLQEYDRSIPYFKEAYELNPAFAQNLIRIAEYCHIKGDFSSEITIYRQLLERKESSLLYYKLGLAAYELGDTETEIASYLKALEIEPDNKDIRYNLGLAYFESGNFNDALAQFLILTKGAEPNANAWYYRALCYINLGEAAKAWEAYESLKNSDSKLADEIYELLKNE
ncbi:MAG: tetratricopeptide repeat protein [Candidatus Auribacterota bacterium]